MERTITIDPVTRIGVQGKTTIQLDDAGEYKVTEGLLNRAEHGSASTSKVPRGLILPILLIAWWVVASASKMVNS